MSIIVFSFMMNVTSTLTDIVIMELINESLNGFQ
jgi:hypothetical protein